MTENQSKGRSGRKDVFDKQTTKRGGGMKGLKAKGRKVVKNT